MLYITRDRGYTLCFVAERESPEEMVSNYGYEGYHYNPKYRVEITI